MFNTQFGPSANFIESQPQIPSNREQSPLSSIMEMQVSKDKFTSSLEKEAPVVKTGRDDRDIDLSKIKKQIKGPI
jgi:hypothetical protein